MSHVTTIEFTEAWDVPTLINMCEAEGWDFVHGQTTYKWFGRHVGDYPLPEGYTVNDMGKCTHAIRIPGANYEIGVVVKDGKVDLLWDFYSFGKLDEKLGKKAEKLKQAYTLAKVRKQCFKNRKRFKETRKEGYREIRISM